MDASFFYDISWVWNKQTGKNLNGIQCISIDQTLYRSSFPFI